MSLTPAELDMLDRQEQTRVYRHPRAIANADTKGAAETEYQAALAAYRVAMKWLRAAKEARAKAKPQPWRAHRYGPPTADEHAASELLQQAMADAFAYHKRMQNDGFVFNYRAAP